MASKILSPHFSACYASMSHSSVQRVSVGNRHGVPLSRGSSVLSALKAWRPSSRAWRSSAPRTLTLLISSVAARGVQSSGFVHWTSIPIWCTDMGGLQPQVASTYFSDPLKRTRRDVDTSNASLRGTLQSLQPSLFQIFNAIVHASPASRERVLAYFARVVNLNLKCGGMQVCSSSKCREA